MTMPIVKLRNPLIAAIASTMIASLPASAQPPSSAALEAAKDKPMLAVPEQYLAAQRDFDAASLAVLTDRDFVEISPVGEIDPRAKMLGFYTPDKKSPAPPMRFERIHAWKDGASGSVIGKIIYSFAAPDGTTRTSELTAAFQLRKVQRQWKLITAQYTPVRPAKPK